MTQPKTNGVVKLSDAIEEMRIQVVELELRARYWKAQYDIRHYTLESEKIQPEYNVFLEENKKKNDKMQKDFEEQLQKLQAQGAEINVDGQPIEKSEFVERVEETIKP